MKNFLMQKNFPLNPNRQIQVRVFSKYSGKGYDYLDDMARKRGYLSIEPGVDEIINFPGVAVGMGNAPLHSGWIATIGDESHNVEGMINLLNKKIEVLVTRKQKFIVGFCQTGHFSVGYSIYIKP